MIPENLITNYAKIKQYKAEKRIFMKILFAFIIFFVSFSVQAACKCNCALGDMTICASDYDLDKPCRGLCAGQAPGTGPMLTACPMIQVPHPWTGIKRWVAVCVRYY